jgi:cysteine protease ATG4
VVLLSWFLDAPAAPFGVHRMALAGKAAGKDAGMWFGPSAAAGALRFVVFHSFFRLFLGDGIGVPELHIFLGYLRWNFL